MLPGASVAATAGSHRPDIEYDAERTTAAEIHDALRQAGIVHVADEPDRGDDEARSGHAAPGPRDGLGTTTRAPKDEACAATLRYSPLRSCQR